MTNFFFLELDEKEEIQVKACQALSAIESLQEALMADISEAIWRVTWLDTIHSTDFNHSITQTFERED